MASINESPPALGEPAPGGEVSFDVDDQFPAARMHSQKSLINLKDGEQRISQAHGSNITLEVRKSQQEGGNVVLAKADFDALVRNVSKKDGKIRSLRSYIGAAIAVIALLAGVSFVTAFLAAEAAKESHVQGMELVNGDGNPIMVANSDIKVDQDGTILRQCEGGAAVCSAEPLKVQNSDLKVENGVFVQQGAQKTSGANTTHKPIATKLNKEKQPITSVIPDHLLHEMSNLVLTAADQTSTLSLQVLGVMRVVAPGSKCGTVVKFHTQIGDISFDDAHVSADSKAAAVLAAAGFSLEPTSAAAGSRRLTADTLGSGFFSFFEDYAWTCSSLDKPGYFEKPFRAVVRRVHPCYGTDCQSSASAGGEPMMKPGYNDDENAIISTEVVVMTETRTAEHVFLPNHPGQAFVTVRDHSAKTIFQYQIALDGSAINCDAAPKAIPNNCGANASGTCQAAPAPDVDLMEDYTPVYLKEEEGFRKFRLVPNPDVDGITKDLWPMEYWDDAVTFKPKYFKLTEARELGSDLESTEVLESNSMTAAEADAYIDGLVGVACADTTWSSGPSPTDANPAPMFDGIEAPVISDPDDPTEEYELSTNYYVGALHETWAEAGSEGKVRAQMLADAVADEYWQAFLVARKDGDDNLYYATFHEGALNTTGRRLGSPAAAEGDAQVDIDPDFMTEVELTRLREALRDSKRSNESLVRVPLTDEARALGRRLGVDWEVELPCPPYMVTYTIGTGRGEFCISAKVKKQMPGILWHVSGDCNICESGGFCHLCKGFTLGFKGSKKKGGKKKSWNCGVEAEICAGMKIHKKGGASLLASARIGGGCMGLSLGGRLEFSIGPCPGYARVKLKASVKASITIIVWKFTIFSWSKTVINKGLGDCR